jgi:predicted metal-dependent hydrolase
MFRKFPRRRKELGKYSIRIDGQDLHYTLKQGHITRYIRLEIWPDIGLVVIVPHKYDIDYVNEFIRSKKAWIFKKLQQQVEKQQIDIDRELVNNDIILFLGNKITVNLTSLKNRDGRVYLEDNRLFVNPHYTEKTVNILVEEWYRFQAKLLLQEKAEEWSRIIGVEYKELNIRAQKTRWGSASRKKIISFNWKLLKAPEPIIDYVVIHELAHLKEMNHSVRFWDMVSQYHPQYKQSRLWLRKNQDLLVSFHSPVD